MHTSRRPRVETERQTGRQYTLVKVTRSGGKYQPVNRETGQLGARYDLVKRYV